VDEELRRRLLSLETALARRDEASIPGGYEAVLDDEFSEIGASGRTWDRAATLAVLGSAAPADVELEDVAFSLPADDAVLLTYRVVSRTADGEVTLSRRASWWIRRAGEWRLRFHQGTPL
jgi:glyoxylase I family protein